MKVLFDVTVLLSSRLNQEGVYCLNLFRSLKGLGVDIDAIYKVPRGVKENHIERHIGSSAKKFYGFFAPKGAILHGPNVNLLSESPKFTKVISVNDMGMFRDGFNDNKISSQLERHLKEQLQNHPEAIFVPTRDVHNDFLVRFPKYLNKVHVVSPGCDHIIDSSTLSGGKVSERPFFLYVGNIDKRGNISAVLRAFQGYCELQNDTNLLIVGEDGYGASAIHKLIDSANMGSRVKRMGYQSQSQLKRIYSDAIATVVPSLYEGFSFPVVEAMKMGCPVVTSARGATEEVARDAAHLVNPTDPEQIMAGMQRVRVDNSCRAKLIEAGQECTQKMTWLSTAKKVAEVYETVVV